MAPERREKTKRPTNQTNKLENMPLLSLFTILKISLLDLERLNLSKIALKGSSQALYDIINFVWLGIEDIAKREMAVEKQKGLFSSPWPVHKRQKNVIISHDGTQYRGPIATGTGEA